MLGLIQEVLAVQGEFWDQKALILHSSGKAQMVSFLKHHASYFTIFSEPNYLLEFNIENILDQIIVSWKC